jgi:spermidine synthase
VNAALLASVFVIATAGLVYELLAGTVASYLLGDSVTQFSTVIGAYLFSMGVGSYLAKYLRRGLVAWFIHVEVLVGLVGGCSAAALFLAFDQVASFQVVLYGVVGLVGMEIPILLRILEGKLQFSELVSRVLSLDYLGALLASILFPLVLVPHLGLVESAFFFGVLNAGVALVTCVVFRAELPAARWLMGESALAVAVLLVGFVYAPELTGVAEGHMYADEIVHARSTAYQRIVLTRSPRELRLYLNGHLQFSSLDEYRYHEALVHPGLASVAAPRRALVLGGGDGMAVRELLRDPRVERVDLVDLDRGMTDLFTTHAVMSRLNDGALRDPRVHVENHDALVWLRGAPGTWDFIVVDFPDPSSFSVGKLYTTTFYETLARHLAPGGRLVVQSTSPLFARRAFWCVVETLEAVGLHVAPYHAYVPSFGEWGFALAGREAFATPTQLPNPLRGSLRFLTDAQLPGLFSFPADMARLPVEVNRLNNQALVQYYDAEWKRVER